MKKTSILFCGLLLAGLSNYYTIAQNQPKKAVSKTTTKTKTKTKTTTTTVKGNSSTADIAQGKQLISKSDCLSCHQLKVKVVGPAYSEVAQKYPATEENITMLSNKIINGGSGNWGQIPMVPHPAIAVADAAKMVKYILSLKGK